MSSGGPFNTVGGLMPRRHFFNLSHGVPLTAEFGKLYPVLVEEMLPGDKFKIGNSITVRTQPLFAPILQSIKIYVEYFFVPNRIVWSDWENFITGGKDGNWSGSLPLWNGKTSGTDTYSSGSLADYCGHPLDVALSVDDLPIAFPQLAYNKIWNEYYRDETIDTEVNEYNNTLLRRRWKKDYFTSALLYPQRGTAPGISFSLANIPVIGTAPIYTAMPGSYTDLPSITDTPFVELPTNRVISTGASENVSLLEIGSNGLQGSSSDLANKRVLFDFRDGSGQTNPNGQAVGLRADATQGNLKVNGGSIGFNISELRLVIQTQKFLERNMRAGYRLNEFLLAHFGLSPRDSVLQRPEYIAGSRANIVVSEVLQTSSTEFDSEEQIISPQGNLAGRGISVSSEYVGHYTASEHGILIGLFSIMPSNLYDSQGLDKRWQRRTRYDYYFPEFAHLSEQPVKKGELMATSTHADNIATFGYQPIYQEYRHRRSYVVGDFRVGKTLEYWTLARHFTAQPALNSTFLQVDPPADRIFPVNTQAPFMVHFGNIVKAYRPLPLLGDPGLMDHF